MPRRRRLRSLKQSATLRVLAVFGVLVGVNVYVFFYGSGSLRIVAQAAETASVRAARLPLVPPLSLTMAGRRLESRSGVLREREGLGAALRREGLGAADADAALRALRPLLDFKRDLRGGQRYVVHRDGDGRLAALELRVGGDLYGVHRAPDGRLLAGHGAVRKRTK